MIPAKPDMLTRAEIKAVFRRHWGSKGRLATDLGKDPQRVSDWFGNRHHGVDPEIVLAIRQRAADLINAERSKLQEKGA